MTETVDSNEALQRVRMEMFWRIHRGLSKQGPGDDPTTLRALEMLGVLPETPRILDLGCGPGRQTLALLRATRGHVRAVDALLPFLEQLDASAEAAGFADRVTTSQASMGSLEPPEWPDGCADLIWSEGAIYNIGFDEGLAHWRRLLVPGGGIAITEATWLEGTPSERVRRFWDLEYPAMRTRAENRRAIEATGYTLVGDFVVPEASWWDDYYTPIEERLAALREERSDAAWQRVVAEFDLELDVVREGLASFGYVFYVARRPEGG